MMHTSEWSPKGRWGVTHTSEWSQKGRWGVTRNLPKVPDQPWEVAVPLVNVLDRSFLDVLGINTSSGIRIAVIATTATEDHSISLELGRLQKSLKMVSF